mmetsp:Transcript_33048/g.76144  ORF Transcript_33048/g.76144 Transcript_33048/m.76144 type:complete len:80 (-) Transcript_33048:589-828(-)
MQAQPDPRPTMAAGRQRHALFSHGSQDVARTFLTKNNKIFPGMISWDDQWMRSRMGTDRERCDAVANGKTVGWEGQFEQ